MFDIVIRRNDDLPKIQKTLYVNGSPFDLSGYTVTFEVDKIDGTNVINNAAQLVDANNGIVAYQWTDADSTAFTDDYGFARFRATGPSGDFTVPNNAPLAIFLTSSTLSEYSYSGNPASRPLDAVRFLLGDTDMSKALFTDSELNYLLTEFTNPYAAASEAALNFSARYTNLRDKTVGPLSIRFGEVSDRWRSLARSLRLRASRRSAAIAITTQASCEPAFRRGMNDFPESQLFDWQNVQDGPPV